MKKQLINFLSVLILLFISSSSIIAQEAVATATSIAKNDTSSISLSVNTVLCIIACVLLLIIIVLATTVSSAIDLFKANKKTFKNISVFIGLLMVSALTFAQEPAAAESVKSVATEASASVKSTIYFYAFILIILIDISIILYFIKMFKFLTGIEQLKKSNDIKELTLWEKFNQLKSIEEEGEIDLGHDYDGIRELDNITPPWFTIAFALSIVAAGIYYYRFEIGHTALTQEQEFEIEMREAKILQDSLLKLEGNQVDENNVAMLDAAGIASGMKLYNTNCGACHGDKGQGGVGPNLTDAYWLHGGSISHVFKSIKYGIVDKGMKSWKEDFSPTQIAQLASFIESIQGTNPPGAKEKQGDLYVASESNATPSDSTKN